MESSLLVFFVNGKKVEDDKVDPNWTLLTYLRKKLKLCGTKLGCAEGGCGACTVMVSKYDRERNKVLHLAVNACLAPVCSMHGLAVTTVEGIGSTKTRLHPVQERIAKAHGSQCGFCTPGIVMSMYTLLRNMPKPSIHDLETTFQGNLCRCTGYRPIIEGYKTFTEEWEREQQKFTNATPPSQLNGACGMGDKCCKNDGRNCDGGNNTIDLYEASEFLPFDPSQEPIFPPELKIHAKYDQAFLQFHHKDLTWFRSTSLERLVDLTEKYPGAKLIVGNTEVGVEVKFKHRNYPIVIHTGIIPELTTIQCNTDGIKIGAAVTLESLEIALKREIKSEPGYKTRIFEAIIEMLRWFAGKQIRNVASVGGNLMTASPISDLNPIFLAANCQIELLSKKGQRLVVMDDKFFTGYRSTIVEKQEVLLSILIPYTKENQYFLAFKQSKRKDDDLAVVNSAINTTITSQPYLIEDLRIAYGGIAPTTVLAIKTGKLLIGKEWNEELLDSTYESLLEELPLRPDAPGGMIQYRRALTLSLFLKSFLKIQSMITSRNSSQITPYDKPFIPTKSTQFFAINPNSGQKTDTVGRPIIHMSAYKQATGEAIYVDDIPSYPNELYLAYILSTECNAKIESVTTTEALAEPGVHAYFSAKDVIPGRNHIGPIVQDEELFVSDRTSSHGQIIGVIIAENQATAQRAARKVRVVYSDVQTPILSIEDAIACKSYFPNNPKRLSKGNVEVAFAEADHIIEGECRTGSQEHFYLETQTALAVPKLEDDEMELFVSTQSPSQINAHVAHLLDLPINRIVTKVKRIGGAFGGKECRSSLVALPVALAAHKLRRPVRCMLDRNEDILMTGGRNPCLIRYKASFTKAGRITACKVDIYLNAGRTQDLSPAVLERALMHFQNAYNIANVDGTGYVCKTNLPSNTAFRGFGGPQAMFAAENMIRDIAEVLNMDPVDICKRNLYQTNDLTTYNQNIGYCTLGRCLEECLEQAKYTEKKLSIERFNRANRWRKRGISLVPTAHGIAFDPAFMNQAGALIHIYTDGSVLLSHGGTEMGQGLHTKMIQVASRSLGVPIQMIHITETSTDKVPNTIETAASVGSDLNGMAILNACEILNKRLQPYKDAHPKASWKEWISKAYFDRVSLSASGFFKTPGLGFNWDTFEGCPYNYFTYGVCCSEIELDCLTGDHAVLSANIVMDLGESLNPAIDIGQIEGAFMQGYGLFVMEDMLYSPDGAVLSQGPGAYKIPAFSDIPKEFNVSLLKGAPNPRAIYSSKAVGEPPLFLASSVLFAIKDAIKAARSESGITTPFRLNAPATVARIRMACSDNITAKVKTIDGENKGNPKNCWNIRI